MPSSTISAFTFGDIIDLASVASGSGGSAVLTSGNVLDVVEGGSTYVLDLNPSQNYSGTKFVLTSDAKTRALFPDSVNAPVQYGARITAFVIYLLPISCCPRTAWPY
jgi:hypothetical protein